MPQLTKKRKVAAGKIDATKAYDLQEATALVKETSTTKFDATVDIAVRLGVDPKKSTEMVRGTVSLPHGTGRTVRVLVPVSYTHLRAHETVLDLVCRLLLEHKNTLDITA